MDTPIKDWGQGIPNYTEDDVLKGTAVQKAPFLFHKNLTDVNGILFRTAADN